MKGINAKQIIIDALKSAFASLVIGLFIVGFILIFTPGLILKIIVGFFLGVAVYFIMTYILGIQEVRALPGFLRNKFFSKK